jgi:hypothetical protein
MDYEKKNTANTIEELELNVCRFKIVVYITLLRSYALKFCLILLLLNRSCMIGSLTQRSTFGKILQGKDVEHLAAIRVDSYM